MFFQDTHRYHTGSFGFFHRPEEIGRCQFLIETRERIVVHGPLSDYRTGQKNTG
jgi:hypothetical protein